MTLSRSLVRALALASLALFINLNLMAGEPETPPGPPPGGTPPPAGDHPKGPGVRGTLSEVTDTSVVILTDKGDKVTLTVNADTKISIDRKPADIAALKDVIGKPVGAKVDPTGAIAVHINVRTTPRPAGPPNGGPPNGGAGNSAPGGTPPPPPAPENK